MKTIWNKTRKPLKLVLGGGHVLHLGPNKTGQVSDHVVRRPSFQRMIELGEIAFLEDAQAEGEPGAPHAEQESLRHRPQRKVVIPSGGRTAGGRRER